MHLATSEGPYFFPLHLHGSANQWLLCNIKELDRSSGDKAAKAVALQLIALHKAIVLTATNCGLLVVQPPAVELLFSSFFSPNVDTTVSLFKSTMQKEKLLPNSFRYLSPSACCFLPFGLQVTHSLLVLLKALERVLLHFSMSKEWRQLNLKLFRGYVRLWKIS